MAWKGMHVGHVQEPTIILDAVASYDLWIWHAFFELPRSHNDIIVLNQSPLFNPPWSTLMKTIPYPQENKHRNFAKVQESTRKDVEQAFRVLQACFAIVRGPARFWGCDTLNDIMKVYVIMHTMIVKDECGTYIEDLMMIKVMKIFGLNHHLNEQYGLWNSFRIIIKFETEKPTLNSKKILLNTDGKIKDLLGPCNLITC
ncbi:hypothetical protein Dsin_027877 [Dipteronia sinensis]|uniref:Uncharacterized protein n=1 Tax=Dipteronia sinensis TaxID=43782 RepID=A0AAD9ZR67_9ROSI|nr:hypothetical protein Dsin_027877 [Dipteronia sinensis]